VCVCVYNPPPRPQEHGNAKPFYVRVEDIYQEHHSETKLTHTKLTKKHSSKQNTPPPPKKRGKKQITKKKKTLVPQVHGNAEPF